MTRARAVMAVILAGWSTAAPTSAWASWPWTREVHVPTARALAEAEQQWSTQAQAGAARRPASPPLTAEMFIRPPRVRQVEPDDGCCITRLRRLNVDPNTPEYDKLLLRLAEHFIEKRGYYERQREAFDEEIVEAEARGPRAKTEQLRAKRAKFVAHSHEASVQATKLLKTLTSAPAMAASPTIPEALLLIALESARLGETAPMREAAERLVLEFPDRPQAVGARLLLAEHAFGRGETAEAAAQYDRALTTARGAARAHAQVQRARCDLHGGATPEAIERLVAAIAATGATIATDGLYAEPLRRLRDAAREELVRTVAADGWPPRRAWPLLQRAGAGATPAEQAGPALLVRLAEVYFETGSHAASTAVYEQLAALFPGDERRCEWQARVVANTLASADRATQLREVDRLAALWRALKEGDAEQRIKRLCRDAALTATRGLALTLHRESAGPPASGAAEPGE